MTAPMDATRLFALADNLVAVMGAAVSIVATHVDESRPSNVPKMLPEWPPPAPATGPFTAQVRVYSLCRPSRPHYRDTPDKTAEKRAAAAEAERHERRFELTMEKPVEAWTAEDIVLAIDRVRTGMPTGLANPLVPMGVTYSMSSLDTYEDGRRLCRVALERAAAARGRQWSIWFSTAGGYGASIELPCAPPSAALAELALSAMDTYGDVELRLNNRAVAAAQRRARKAAEVEAREAFAAATMALLDRTIARAKRVRRQAQGRLRAVRVIAKKKR